MAEEPSSRLAVAAQELLETAGVEASSKHQKKISTDLLSFKESVDAKLNTVNQTITTSRAHIDDKANTVNQRLSSLEQAITQQTQEISKQMKLQNLSFAIQNVNKLSAFEYHEPNSSYGQRKQSSDLVLSILFSFRRGRGWYLPDGAMDNVQKNYFKEQWEKSNKEFRDKVIVQIHSLIGTKPRVIKEADGRFAVYYS